MGRRVHAQLAIDVAPYPPPFAWGLESKVLFISPSGRREPFAYPPPALGVRLLIGTAVFRYPHPLLAAPRRPRLFAHLSITLKQCCAAPLQPFRPAQLPRPFPLPPVGRLLMARPAVPARLAPCEISSAFFGRPRSPRYGTECFRPIAVSDEP